MGVDVALDDGTFIMSKRRIHYVKAMLSRNDTKSKNRDKRFYPKKWR